MELEVFHLMRVLESTKKALLEKDAVKLKELSDQTIHSACGIQDAGSITLAVLDYSLSKLLERKEHIKIKNWRKFLKKIDSYLELAIKSLKQERYDKYEVYLILARKSLSSISVNLKPQIQEILRKASINKASKLYEHGLSLGQTSNLLGITEWELAEYTGQKPEPENKQAIDIKSRAKLALEFFE